MKLLNTGLRAIASAVMLVTLTATTSCDNDSGTPPVGPVPSAGEITGPDVIYEGYPITLSVSQIEGATTYKWYRDDVSVQHTASTSLIVTSAGAYRVAGVNANGEGASSPVKTVSPSADKMFIDRLVGQWNVTEYIVNPNNNYTDLNDHVITITKIDAQTIEISNFAWANYPDDSGDKGDTFRASIDSQAETMTILPPAEFVPSWVADYATFLCPVMSSVPGDNLGLDFPTQSFTENESGKLQLVMKTGEYSRQINIGQSETITLPVTYMVNTMQLSIYTGTLSYYLGTIWTKQ